MPNRAGTGPTASAVLDVLEPGHAEPRPSTFVRTLASKRSRATAWIDSLTTTATRRGMNGATPNRGGRRPASSARSRTAAGMRWGAILALATSSPPATTCPSNRLNTSMASIRLSRSSRAIRTWTTPAAAASRSTRLSAGPGSARRLPSVRRAAGPLRLRGCRRARDQDSHGLARFGVRKRNEVVGGQSPPLLPAGPCHRQVTGEDGSYQTHGHTPARSDSLGLHEGLAGDQCSRARAASIARRV